MISRLGRGMYVRGRGRGSVWMASYGRAWRLLKRLDIVVIRVELRACKVALEQSVSVHKLVQLKRDGVIPAY